MVYFLETQKTFLVVDEGQRKCARTVRPPLEALNNHLMPSLYEMCTWFRYWPFVAGVCSSCKLAIFNAPRTGVFQWPRARKPCKLDFLSFLWTQWATTLFYRRWSDGKNEPNHFEHSLLLHKSSFFVQTDWRAQSVLVSWSNKRGTTRGRIMVHIKSSALNHGAYEIFQISPNLPHYSVQEFRSTRPSSWCTQWCSSS